MQTDLRLDELSGRLVTALFGALRRLKPLEAAYSPADLITLSQIGRQEGVGVSELAQRQHIAHPTMSVLIKRLQASGLVSRSPHPDDGRRTVLKLTEAGVGVLEDAKRQRTQAIGDLLDTLSEHDLSKLWAALPVLEQIGGLRTA